jgi:hypothetical protein
MVLAQFDATTNGFENRPARPDMRRARVRPPQIAVIPSRTTQGVFGIARTTGLSRDLSSVASARRAAETMRLARRPSSAVPAGTAHVMATRSRMVPVRNRSAGCAQAGVNGDPRLPGGVSRADADA